jgi:hypothetical protein
MAVTTAEETLRIRPMSLSNDLFVFKSLIIRSVNRVHSWSVVRIEIGVARDWVKVGSGLGCRDGVGEELITMRSIRV